ncbi:general odorant-binding protein 99a-like [Teleopsis dalmanni]|uniref:general odorant-binding protein 99a-like n=1 Tax=Teleopsis dalmanni TaxID=139649 RepID=UPI0018CCFE53|nr:general odorant-binding protein 99a-like [Teleopsis dalmanni]XP_037954339.1 general odorant-binding protein 99a-like [Teleopsis dalmanni]
MKAFYILAILAVVSSAFADWNPKTASEIKEIRVECVKEHPLTEDVIAKMKQFDYPDVESVRKYLLCTATKMDIFCEHEGYHPDRVAKQFRMDLDESEALTIVEGCVDKNEQGSPVDVWAFRGHQCIMRSKIGDKVKAYIKKRLEEASKSK